MDDRDPELEFNSEGMKTKQKTLVTQGKVAGSVDFSIPGSLPGRTKSLVSCLEKVTGLTPPEEAPFLTQIPALSSVPGTELHPHPVESPPLHWLIPWLIRTKTKTKNNKNTKQAKPKLNNQWSCFRLFVCLFF